MAASLKENAAFGGDGEQAYSPCPKFVVGILAFQGTIVSQSDCRCCPYALRNHCNWRLRWRKVNGVSF